MEHTSIVHGNNAPNRRTYMSPQLSETFGYVDLELDTVTQQLVGWEATRVMLDEDAPFDEEMSVLLRAAEELASVEREIGWAIAPFGCPDNELAAVADGGGASPAPRSALPLRDWYQTGRGLCQWR